MAANNFLKTSKLLVIAILLLFSSASDAQTRSLVVLFGDSITVGFNSGRRIDFPNGSTTISGPRQFLSDLLNDPNQNRNAVVANWGEGGTSSSRGVDRIRSHLGIASNNNPADQFFVMLMYGTNDFGRGISLGTTAFNNGQMIRSARLSGYLPVVGTVNIGPLAASIASIAAINNAQVVDQFSFFNARPLAQNFELETSLITGQLIRLHPNDDGYRRLVQNWFDGALRNLISVALPPPPPPPPPFAIAPIIPLVLED